MGKHNRCHLCCRRAQASDLKCGACRAKFAEAMRRGRAAAQRVRERKKQEAIFGKQIALKPWR